MEFEYKLQRQRKRYKEFCQYYAYSSSVYRVIFRSYIVPLYISVIMLLFSMFSYNLSMFIAALAIIAIMLPVFFVVRAIIVHRRNKSKAVVGMKEIDADSIFKVNIKDGMFTIENEFSFLQFPLEKAEYIGLLKEELVINFASWDVFIPMDALPLGISEFIDIFKEKNSLLKVTNFSKKLRNRRNLYKTIYCLTIVVVIVVSYFVDKYGFI